MLEARSGKSTSLKARKPYASAEKDKYTIKITTVFSYICSQMAQIQGLIYYPSESSQREAQDQERGYSVPGSLYAGSTCIGKTHCIMYLLIRANILRRRQTNLAKH